MSDNGDTIKRKRLNQGGHKEAFLKVLCAPDCLGNVMVAARKTGVARQTLYRWRKEDVVFAAEWDKQKSEADELLVDEAQSALVSAIKAGNITAIIFTLKTRAPERWGENRSKNTDNKIEDEHTLSAEFSTAMDRFYNRHHLTETSKEILQ